MGYVMYKRYQRLVIPIESIKELEKEIEGSENSCYRFVQAINWGDRILLVFEREI